MIKKPSAVRKSSPVRNDPYLRPLALTKKNVMASTNDSKSDLNKSLDTATRLEISQALMLGSGSVGNGDDVIKIRHNCRIESNS